MKYLAIDTSGDLIVIAHSEGKNAVRYLNGCNTKHSITLMPYVEECMDELKLALVDLDFIAVVVGPGSFTGIRIGVATAKALCFASGKPILPLTSFDLLAYSDNAPLKSVCLIDANHGNYYVCAYQNGEAQTKPAFMTEEQIKSEFSHFQAVASHKLENFDNFVANLPSGLTNAVNALNKNCTHHENCYPLYVKRSQAEEELC